MRRLTSEELANQIAADCMVWMREMRQSQSHEDLDRAMAFVRSQYKPRKICHAIQKHFEGTTYPQTSEDIGPRPTKPKHDPVTAAVRDHKLAAAGDRE